MNSILRKFYNLWTVLSVIVILLALYLVVLYPWLNRWGSTDAELTMPLPGDGTDPGRIISSTRAITINAPAGDVWKWIVQLGQDRAGFYSNDWLENLVFSDIHNGDQIRPDWQHRQIGEKILGAGGLIYQSNQYWPTKAYQDGKMLYLWGPIVVVPVDNQSARLILRTYAQPTNLAMMLSYDWMHFVMERGLLLGVKARAEGTINDNIVLEGLADFGWIAAAIAMSFALFRRRRGWAWGLIPLAYAVAIFGITRDAWSAIAGYLWWGVIEVGFIASGPRWWKGLALATALVVLVFVLASQPHVAFGLIFLAILLAALAIRMVSQKKLFTWSRVLPLSCIKVIQMMASKILSSGS